MVQRIKIHVVSSEEMVRLALREFLEVMSFDVATHVSVKEFMHLFAPRPDGYLFIDLDNTEMKIGKILDRLMLKAIKNHAIFITERKSEIMNDHAWKASDPVILQKPLTEPAVVKAINYLVTQHGLAEKRSA